MLCLSGLRGQNVNTITKTRSSQVGDKFYVFTYSLVLSIAAKSPAEILICETSGIPITPMARLNEVIPPAESLESSEQ